MNRFYIWKANFLSVKSWKFGSLVLNRTQYSLWSWGYNLTLSFFFFFLDSQGALSTTSDGGWRLVGGDMFHINPIQFHRWHFSGKNWNSVFLCTSSNFLLYFYFTLLRYYCWFMSEKVILKCCQTYVIENCWYT